MPCSDKLHRLLPHGILYIIHFYIPSSYNLLAIHNVNAFDHALYFATLQVVDG